MNPTSTSIQTAAEWAENYLKAKEAFFQALRTPSLGVQAARAISSEAQEAFAIKYANSMTQFRP